MKKFNNCTCAICALNRLIDGEISASSACLIGIKDYGTRMKVNNIAMKAIEELKKRTPVMLNNRINPQEIPLSEMDVGCIIMVNKAGDKMLLTRWYNDSNDCVEGHWNECGESSLGTEYDIQYYYRVR